jgi:tryptophan-rich sensory protein
MNTGTETKRPWGRDIGGLLFWLALSAIVASFGGYFGPEDWYPQIVKPSWNPPGWVFGPVWTALYIAMAVAAWRVWRVGGWRQNRTPLTFYLVQLVLNAAWSWIFFGLHSIGWAVVDILALLAVIVFVTARFWKKERVAGWLMVPYVLWVGFASVLNFRIWTLN